MRLLLSCSHRKGKSYWFAKMYAFFAKEYLNFCKRLMIETAYVHKKKHCMRQNSMDSIIFFNVIIFLGACYSFAYIAHFVFLRDVWIRTHAESCRILSRNATNLASHLL